MAYETGLVRSLRSWRRHQVAELLTMTLRTKACGSSIRCSRHAATGPERSEPDPSAMRRAGEYRPKLAGQQVSQVTFAGRNRRQDPATSARTFAVFAIMRQLHELPWHLASALALGSARAVHVELRRAVTATEAMTGWPADGLLELGDRGSGSFRR